MTGAAGEAGRITTVVGATEVSDELELIELGPEDKSAVTELVGSAPDSATRWVGVRVGEQLIAAAGWLPTQDGVRMVSPTVREDYQRQGIGDALIGAIEELSAVGLVEQGGLRTKRLFVSAADPGLAQWLMARGFTGQDGSYSRSLPLFLDVPTAEHMQELGRHLAGVVQAGDVIILNGELGAGKTTFTQGLGIGLGVEEPVTSPTFVLSRIHPGHDGKPDLVHVDAYRLADLDEVDDIDLDSDLDHSVTVIEWGAGVAEQLSAERLEIEIRRSDDPAEESRVVVLHPIGPRWIGVPLIGEGADG